MTIWRGWLNGPRSGRTETRDEPWRRPPDGRSQPPPFRAGQRECRLRQDQDARGPGRTASAQRRTAGVHPLRHLHQGGGVGDAETPVRDPGRLCDCTGRGADQDPVPPRRTRRRRLRRGAPVRGAATVCFGSRNAGRAEDPDTPRFLREAAPPVSAGGGRIAGLFRARLRRRGRSDAAGPRRTGAAREGSGQPGGRSLRPSGGPVRPRAFRGPVRPDRPEPPRDRRLSCGPILRRAFGRHRRQSRPRGAR